MDVTFWDVYTSQKSVFGADFYTGWVSSSAHSGCRLQGQKNDWASIFGQMLVKAVEGRNQMLHVFEKKACYFYQKKPKLFSFCSDLLSV